jgi:hypothetical protein
VQKQVCRLAERKQTCREQSLARPAVVGVFSKAGRRSASARLEISSWLPSS